jgi:hypothetical protein
VPANLDDGHLDWYFFLLAGLMGMTIVYLYWIAQGYEYKTARELALFDHDDEDDEPVAGGGLTVALTRGVANNDHNEDGTDRDRELSMSDLSTKSAKEVLANAMKD